MMKVLISADAEGISGIFKKSQVTPGTRDYDSFRGLMAGDVNAAIRGAFAGGATEVVVNDCHNYEDNLRITDLDPRASLMAGADKPLLMAEGLDRDVDALFLVGYHARKGARGVISHTFYYGVVADAVVNGVPFGEADFVAHAAGYFGVPTVLITGDDCVTDYARQRIPGITTAVVKEVIGNGSAHLYHPVQTAARIEAAAKSATEGYRSVAPLPVEGPFTLELTFLAATQADLACQVPGFRHTPERDSKVVFTCGDYLELYKAFLHALTLAATFNDQF